MDADLAHRWVIIACRFTPDPYFRDEWNFMVTKHNESLPSDFDNKDYWVLYENNSLRQENRQLEKSGSVVENEKGNS